MWFNKVCIGSNARPGRACCGAGARSRPPPPAFPNPARLLRLATVPLNKLHAETPNRFSAIASPPHRPPNNTKSLFYRRWDIVKRIDYEIIAAIGVSLFPLRSQRIRRNGGNLLTHKFIISKSVLHCFRWTSLSDKLAWLNPVRCGTA